MDLKRHAAREEAAQWLAKLDRGLRQGERLEDVLTETHRYTKTRFVLADQELSETRVSGDFRAGDIDDFLSSLRRNWSDPGMRTRQDVWCLPG